MCERGGEHPEDRRVVLDVLDVDGARDLTVPGRHRDLPRRDQRGELGCRRALETVPPEPFLGHRVDDVDELGELVDAAGVVTGRGVQAVNARLHGYRG